MPSRNVLLAFLLLCATASHAEISLRASATATGNGGTVTYVATVEGSGGAGSVTLAIPAAAQEGDLLLASVAVEGQSAAGITPPTGWTQIRGENAGDHTQVTYYRLATAADVAGPASWLWDWTGTLDFSASITAFRGVNPAAPIDDHSGAATSATNTTTINIPAVTPTAPNTLLVAVASIRSGSAFGGWSGGLAERADDRSAAGGDEVGHGVATRAGPAAGGSSGAFTVTASDNDTSRVGQLIALAPAGLTMTMPQGTGQGDLLIATVAVESQTAATITMVGGGFTLARSSNDGDHTLLTYYRFATAGDVSSAATSWNWSWPAARDYSAALLVFRGVQAGSPVDDDGATVGTGTSATVGMPAVTPTVAGTMILAIASIRSQSTFSAWSNSLVQQTSARSGAVADSIALGTAIRPGTGAGVSTGAFTSAASATDASRIGHTLALAPATVPGPVLRWRMDEASWLGGVIDASGNNLHGTAFLGAGTTATNARFCRSGSFNGTDQYAQIAADPLLDMTDRLTISAWVRPGAYGAELKSVVSKDENYEFHLTNTGRINWYWRAGANAITTAGTVPLNAWTHIAIVYTPGAQEVFINGVLDSHNWTNPDRATLVPNADPFQVGQDQGYGTRWFNGLIDEVRVYDHAMSAADVLTLYNDAPTPSCTLSHFTVVPTGGASASTCLAKGFLITARDGNGNVYTPYAGTVNLAASSGRGNWANGDGGGAVGSGAGNDGAATYGFVGGDASDVTLNLGNTSQDDLVVTVADNAQPWVTGSSGTVNFRDNVFLLSEDLSSLVAGTAVAVAGRPHDMRATYVYKDSVTANCGTLTSYDGAKNIKAWIGRDGNDPGGAAPQIGAVSLPDAAPGANNLTLTFTNGVANFNLATTDVGKYAVNLRDDAPGVANTAVGGTAGPLTVRPFTLAVSGIAQGATANPGNSGSGGTVFAAAGTNFGLTVGAYRHSAAADADNDGVPDSTASFAQSSAAGLAPSFAGTASFSAVAPFAPAAGGVLNNASIAMTAGAASPTTLNFSEVGSFTLSTADVVSSYLGTAGENLAATVFNAAGTQTTAAPVIGRFRPDRFALSGSAVLANRAAAACAPASSFTYMNESLSLAFTLVAQNAQGATTANYHGAYAKFDPTSFAGYGFGARSGSTNLTARIDSAFAPAGTWANGVANVAAATAIKRPAPDIPDGPYPALQVGIAPSDADGVQMAALDLDADGNGSADRKNLGVVTEIRFGRLRVENAVGVEVIPLNVPVRVQYWAGSGFVTNAQDSCTRLGRDNISLVFAAGSSLGSCETALTAPTISFAAGEATLRLAAPGATNAGSLRLEPQLASPAAGSYCPSVGAAPLASVPAHRSYLLGRWDDADNPDALPATAYDDEPVARAAFGVYGARPRNFIFYRENY
jgi:MSHA biogenesis protein MshQ